MQRKANLVSNSANDLDLSLGSFLKEKAVLIAESDISKKLYFRYPSDLLQLNSIARYFSSDSRDANTEQKKLEELLLLVKDEKSQFKKNFPDISSQIEIKAKIELNYLAVLSMTKNIIKKDAGKYGIKIHNKMAQLHNSAIDCKQWKEERDSDEMKKSLQNGKKVRVTEYDPGTESSYDLGYNTPAREPRYYESYKWVEDTEAIARKNQLDQEIDHYYKSLPDKQAEYKAMLENQKLFEALEKGTNSASELIKILLNFLDSVDMIADQNKNSIKEEWVRIANENGYDGSAISAVLSQESSVDGKLESLKKIYNATLLKTVEIKTQKENQEVTLQSGVMPEPSAPPYDQAEIEKQNELEKIEGEIKQLTLQKAELESSRVTTGQEIVYTQQPLYPIYFQQTQASYVYPTTPSQGVYAATTNMQKNEGNHPTTMNTWNPLFPVTSSNSGLFAGQATTPAVLLVTNDLDQQWIDSFNRKLPDVPSALPTQIDNDNIKEKNTQSSSQQFGM